MCVMEQWNEIVCIFIQTTNKGIKMKKETLQKIIDTSNILAIPVATAAGVWWTSFDIGAYVLGTFALLNSVCEYLKLFCKK